MPIQNPTHTPGGLATRLNPRRTSPENSVSLRRQQPLSKFPSSDESSGEQSDDDVSAASNVAVHAGVPKPTVKRTAELPTAEKWFDDSNNNAIANPNVSFMDDDPPFYLRKQRSSDDETGSGEQESSSLSGPAPGSFDLAPAIGGSNDSSRDDYRSVIDDLTVENQELKRKLRKYEGLHSAHMQEEKLFEVRVYKLSQARRRRLESMLREFVSNLGCSPPDSQTSSTIPPMASIPYHSAPPVNAKRSTSSTSNRPVDSAYASMSASGGASVSHAQTYAEPRPPIRPALVRPVSSNGQRPAPPKDQRVQSYLQTISRRLLPKYPPVMTEKTKKKLVVSRLEQLFVGRTGSASKHSQSQQQQEVSQSAATADRRETEAMGHRVQAEGRREAKILRPPADVPAPSADIGNNGSETATATAAPDQRPTRPLDLDPARAQNPTETISYMKHLGFSSPNMDPTRPYGTEEGWIFLNLLINMAQLHTLNVTPSFVRNAIRELSTQLEMSEDGQNIRWRGGPQPSKLSSDSSTNSDESADSIPEELTGEKSHAKLKTGRNVPTESREAAAARVRLSKQRPVRNRPWPRASEHFYSPMFYTPEEGMSGSPSQEVVSSNSPPKAEDRSGGVSAGSTSLENPRTWSKAAGGETGNLIFYNRARFCADLRGDPTLPPSNAVYDRRTQEVIGVSQPKAVRLAKSETKGPLSSPAVATLTATDVDMDELCALDGFDGPWPSTVGKPQLAPPRRLPVCGVGGITPSDNFCIDVGWAYRGRLSRIIGVSRRDLAPTPLPPPSYAFLPYSSSSSDTEGSSNDGLRGGGLAHLATTLNERHYVPPAFLGEFSSHSGSRAQGLSHDTTTANDSSSMDMLEFARQADPEGVAQQEREYEEVYPQREAEEQDIDNAPPPGSVTATLGDRSAFPTSQEDNASVDERQRRLMQDRKSGLKRERSDWGGSQRASKTRK